MESTKMSKSPTVEKQNKKLRILCVHGYNNNPAIMEFMIKDFMHKLGDVAEFDSNIVGPYPSPSDPIPYFTKRNYSPPFPGWFVVHNLAKGTDREYLSVITQDEIDC